MGKISDWLVGILCCVYIILPIDLVPEALLGPFGLPDDLVALFYAIRRFKSALRKDRRHRSDAMPGKQARLARDHVDHGSDRPGLSGRRETRCASAHP